MQEMLARIDATLPPLGGVIHSVGQLSDGVLTGQTWERFEQVMWPKILGAWQLHRATEKQRPGTCLSLFSSLSGIRGNPGQGNHAAANTFLDQLAAHRRSLGLPGQAIQWGAWAGLGEAEEQRERIGDFMAAFGTGWMKPQQGVRTLDRLVRKDIHIRRGRIHRLACVRGQSPSSHAPKELEELLPKAAAATAETPSASGNLMSRLRDASAERT